ncbi:Twinkle protein, mitochondrial [Trichinella patagoniensis]|uniref:Twinkle protein, mitochondrial n=1 Tax=Trichinella patagoniensis TaxID=990121 RepID=A0A0V1A6V7_9BILA|nr:Twinkle protein, mitochondrial [Trichinella patagoniensis]
MVSLKQELQVLDYFGAFCVFISFFVIILIISVTCILWFCVSPTDDVTVFAKKTILRCQGGTEAAKSVKRNGKEKEEEKKANFDAWPSLFMFSSVSIAMPADIYYKARLFRRGACSCVAAHFVPYNKPNNTHSISTVFCRCCFPNSNNNNNNNNNRTKSDCSCERCLAGGLSLALQDWNALRAINCFLPRWEKQQPATVEDEQNSCVLERTELRKRDMNELWDQSLPVSHMSLAKLSRLKQLLYLRNVTDVTLNRYNVRALPSLDGLIFPRYSVTLEMMGSQIRPSGLKICRLVETINMMTVADEVLPSVSTFNGMFGYHLVRQSDSEVVLTLNEADAMSIFQACSKLAVVLPDNPGHFNVEVVIPICQISILMHNSFEQLFLPYLEEFTKITLWLPPEKYNRAKQLSKKLLSNQCYLISPKACNNLRAAETLAIPGKGRELINGVIRQGEAVVHKYVDTLAMLRDPVRSFLFGYNGQTCGVVQWKRFSLLNSYLKGFRLGELTLLTGPFGCGKKTFLCEYALDLCDQNMVTLWCGLELPSIRVVATMIEQYARRISQGSLATAIIRLLAIEYHASAQDVQHVVIDNALLIHDCSSQTFTELKRFASSKNLHITAIVHPKKVPLRILFEVENPIGTISAYSIYSSLIGAYEADNILQITTHINKNQQQQCELEKYLQIWKNRNVGELLIGCLVEMHFDPLSKCHSLVMRKKKIRPGCVD